MTEAVLPFARCALECGKVVLASGNAGKLAEIERLLSGLELRVVPQAALGVEAPEETGQSFLENAILKARHAAAATGLPSLADDSGLAVDALGGAPGIRSARYAGPGADDEANRARLLGALGGAGSGARFHCAVAGLADGADPTPLVCEGVWEGRVVSAPRGQGGFGYDPLFLVPELGLTAAELDAAAKDRLSHRGRAVALLAARLAAARRAT